MAHLHPRALMEIFKFEDSFKVMTFGGVCHAWHRAVNDRELWLHYVSTQFPDEPDLIVASNKEMRDNYVNAVLRSRTLVNVDWGASMVEEFDLMEHHMSRRRMDSKYPYACPSWCRLGKKAVLICGGFTLSKPTEPSADLTVLLSLQDCSFTPRADMLKGRYRHALIPYGRFIYCFGGRTVDGDRSCEKYNRLADTWQALPSMRECRYSITPAVFQSKVYLIGSGKGVDVLHLYTETFTYLEVLPNLEWGCSAISSRDCIYVLARDEVLSWDGKSSQMEHRARVEPGIWFSPAPVCKLEDTVLLITEFGVKQFDPALLQVTDLPAALWHHRASVS